MGLGVFQKKQNFPYENCTLDYDQEHRCPTYYGFQHGGSYSQYYIRMLSNWKNTKLVSFFSNFSVYPQKGQPYGPYGAYAYPGPYHYGSQYGLSYSQY